MSRRGFLAGALSGSATLAAALESSRPSGAASIPLGLARPGTLPDPSAPAGTDLLPEISTIVVVMLENHSYDNILGMLPGRGRGFRLGLDGKPVASNPGPKGETVRAFPMPNPCQLDSYPYNTWDATHQSYNRGRMDGFVKSQSGPVSMGYFGPEVLPFVNYLASTFPVCDNYFCSVMAQTFPNRRYLLAGTSLGLINDSLNGDRPPHGTIFEALNSHGIAWKDYYATTSNPSALSWLYLSMNPDVTDKFVGIDQFYADAAAGTLPGFSLVDPDFGKSSEENPQDVQFGDQFLGEVVGALMASPQWPSTVLVWCYDESGGYYDHVPPPSAVKPDGVPPALSSSNRFGGAFNRYGLRVPAGVVSPFARPDYVSHVVHDHTSVLKLIERKWNLPALTRRDAAADDLLDCLDLVGPPAFATPPLAAPTDPSVGAGCLTTGPGTIPPPGYVKKR